MWREAWAFEKAAASGDVTMEDVLENFLPVDVREALDRALVEFGDRLELKLNSRSFVDGNPFLKVADFYSSLRFLATTYFDSKVGIKGCADLDAVCRDESGFFFKPHQSELTTSKYANYYETEWDGKTVLLEAHLGRGTTKDARHTIRVAFFFDAAKQKLVIGYVGQHQRTGGT